MSEFLRIQIRKQATGWAVIWRDKNGQPQRKNVPTKDEAEILKDKIRYGRPY